VDGRNHDTDQRARWSKSRKGKNSGPENPNYGKFGEDHPSFGHVMSEQARQQLAEKRRGPANPNYGRRERGDAREDVGSA
jgi:NUMOD3 motif